VYASTLSLWESNCDECIAVLLIVLVAVKATIDEPAKARFDVKVLEKLVQLSRT
jgi:hypothetical protein